MEQTFIMIKPDGVQRGLIGEIIRKFEQKGFSLKGLKLISDQRDIVEKHYEHHSGEFFFKSLIEYMLSGPIVAMVWEGKNVVATGRKFIGNSDIPGTVRGDYAIYVNMNTVHGSDRNVIHGSDSVESANKEIALWFQDGLVNWQSSLNPWIYE